MERYFFIDQIGKGSFGNASLVQDTEDNNKYVVLKKINIGSESSDLESAIKEATILKNLQHPNVIQFLNSFQSSPTEYCIVLEYADAKDLKKYLDRHQRKNLSEDRVLQIFSQIILGLSYIHSKNIIHRDIKIQNIFLFKNGLVKIGDFGISRQISSNNLATSVIGTPFYMAPEIFNDSKYGFPADIWSAGCVLFQLMTRGRPPFNGISRDDLINNIISSETPSVPKEYSYQLRHLLYQLLQKDPKLRPTAKQILKIPIIKNTLKNLEVTIKHADNQHNQKIKKSPNKQKAEQPTESNEDSINQEDIPEWIKNNEEVAAGLIRQSVCKFAEDMNMLHQIINSQNLNGNRIFPEFSSDLIERREKIESICREKLGDDKFDLLFQFVKENWSQNREQIQPLLDIDFYPDDEMKLIDSLMMIDRFLSH